MVHERLEFLIENGYELKEALYIVSSYKITNLDPYYNDVIHCVIVYPSYLYVNKISIEIHLKYPKINNYEIDSNIDLSTYNLCTGSKNQFFPELRNSDGDHLYKYFSQNELLDELDKFKSNSRYIKG